MKRLLVLLLIILRETGPTSSQQPTCHSSCPLSFCNCRDVGLNGVPQFLPENITYLYLYGNEITTLREYEFSRYRSLLRLNLGSNKISSISNNAFHGLTILHDLKLYSNRLTSVLAYMFEGLDNLEILDLRYNGMNSIEVGTFSSTPKLRSLNLYYNKISTVAPDTLANLSQFSSLDLTYNRISTFPVGLLSNPSMLSDLRLSHNHMETLPPEAYDILASISRTNLGSNPWQCDCRMLPFKHRMTGSYLLEYQLTCAGPASLQGKSLLFDVNPEDMVCEQTTVSPRPSSSSVVHPGPSTSFQTHITALTTPSSPGLTPVSSSPTSHADPKPRLSTAITAFPSTPVESFLSPTTPKPTSASFKLASTKGQPKMTESNAGPSPGSFSLSDFLSGLLGAAVLICLCAILFTIRCISKRRSRGLPSGQNCAVFFANTNLPAAVTIGGQIQTGQGRNSLGTSRIYDEVTDDVTSPSHSQLQQSSQRQHQNRSEPRYQVPSPSSAIGGGPQAYYQNELAAAQGADAPNHHYESLGH